VIGGLPRRRVPGIRALGQQVVVGVLIATDDHLSDARDIAGALPMDTIVLNASIILVSVLVGIGVVLVISPALGP